MKISRCLLALALVGVVYSTALAGDATDLTVKVGKEKVTVLDGSKTLCVVHPARLFVENTKLIDKGASLIVKSRASHGPAAVELFDVKTGKLKASIFAYEIKDGKPAWAAEFAE